MTTVKNVLTGEERTIKASASDVAFVQKLIALNDKITHEINSQADGLLTEKGAPGNADSFDRLKTLVDELHTLVFNTALVVEASPKPEAEPGFVTLETKEPETFLVPVESLPTPGPRTFTVEVTRVEEPPQEPQFVHLVEGETPTEEDRTFYVTLETPKVETPEPKKAGRKKSKKAAK